MTARETLVFAVLITCVKTFMGPYLVQYSKLVYCKKWDVLKIFDIACSSSEWTSLNGKRKYDGDDCPMIVFL